MKTILICASIVSLLAAAANAQNEDITWQTATNITGTSDVITLGTYFGSWAPYDGGANSLSVNGVAFQGFSDLSGLSTLDLDNGYNGFGSPGTPDGNYNALLQYAIFANETPSSFTWNGMTPGHTYLIQIWVNDGRNIGQSRYETFTGGANTSGNVLYGSTGSGPGQYITGEFVADSSGAETIAINPFSSGPNPDAQINLVQVRDLTPAPNITWGAPAAVSGTTDVSTWGIFYGSWAPGDDAYDPDALPVNGVTFNAYGSLPGLRSTGFDNHYTGFNEPSTPDGNYDTILQAATYNDTGNPAVATLISWYGMTLGHTYLVEIWANDGRGNDRSETFTGGANTSSPLNFGNAPGEFITGTFVADGSGAETITLDGSASDNGDYPQANLLQVRDITVQITGISVSGTTLNLSATNGAVGGPFVLLGTTNLTLPLSQWTPILTNNFDVNGNLNLSTNIVNSAVPQQFYLLSQ
jgi:hypothetical protein